MFGEWESLGFQIIGVLVAKGIVSSISSLSDVVAPAVHSSKGQYTTKP